MRNVVVVVVIVLFSLCSCKTSEKRQREKFVQDSIAVVEKRRLEIIDSLNNARIDSLSLIAWGDALFGMSPKEVLKTKAFKGDTEYVKGNRLNNGFMSRSYISLPSDKKHFLEEDLELNISTFDACFEMEELELIHIKTYDVSARHLNDIKSDMNFFVSSFTEKYGKPSYQKDSFNIFDFESGERFCFARWEIGTKEISIYIGEDEYDPEYYYEVYIRNSKFPTKVDTEEKEIQKKRKLEKQEQRKYQF